jgi:hypothetical protein
MLQSMRHAHLDRTCRINGIKQLSRRPINCQKLVKLLPEYTPFFV